ncbi:MAG: hypothetical protein K2L49_01805, partial [Muribaculaceae bacterium]|nr:hypothetical protein [Muribaculaceae bacterium]
MSLRYRLNCGILTVAAMVSAITLTGCSRSSKSSPETDQHDHTAKSKGKVGGPQLGTPGVGPVIDKT